MSDLLPMVIEQPMVKKKSIADSVRDFVTGKKGAWLTVTNSEYVKLKVTPDSSARNWRTEDILRTISEQFRLPIDRIITEGFKIKGYRLQERAAFEISFINNKVHFYFHIPKNIAPLLIRRLQSVWDKSTVEQVESTTSFNIEKTIIFESVYRKHDMYSLHTDAKDNLPLGSLLEAGRLVGKNEKAVVFTYFDPMHQMSWNYELNEAWTKLRGGRVPRKWNASAREVLRGVGTIITTVLSELFAGVSEILSPGGKSQNVYLKSVSDPEASQFAIAKLSESTKQKVHQPGIKASIWTIVESEDESRANLIGRSLAMSFGDLAGDNELSAKEITNKKKKLAIVSTYYTKVPPKIVMRSNKMSTAEASKLIQIPGLELQEQFHEVDRVDTKQVEITNKNLLKDSGILIGEAIFKGEKFSVYQPIHDIDELCLPHVGIGGMGQGKTKGLLSNYLLESVIKGFGGLAIDPAKGEIGDEIEHAVKKKVIQPEQFVRYNLSVTPFSLDFAEAMHDDRARARLANIVTHFFGVSEETTGQTERFLRAAVIGMRTGKISEIMQIFENEEYLDKTIKLLEESEDEFNLSTLREYKSYQVGMRRKILSPIYNRINDILGDPFLNQCLKSNNTLDMVDILSQKKAVVFDVLAQDLDKIAIDVIVSLLSLKIDLAMRMRKKVHNKEEPFFIMIDEPHQFSKSTKIWEDAVVESRKYKLCYFWTFHYWDQIPRKLQSAIRNALPHYHLYPTTSQTFSSLSSEILPFTVQDALKVKRFHAINIIRTGGENAIPFIAKMTEPPTIRYK